MLTRFAKLTSQLAITLLFLFGLAACGGGSGGGGGFIPDTSEPSVPLSITTSVLPEAASGTDYTALVEAEGGKAPLSWAIIDDGGTGFEINNEGFITGTAPGKGDYGLTIEVTDSANKTDKLSVILTAAIGPDSLTITTTALPTGIEGLQYTALLQAGGGKEPYAWTILSNGGTGFTINNEGLMTGTVPESGDYGLTIQVTDSANATNKTSFIFTATGDTPQQLAIATTSLPNAEEQKGYAAILEAVGGRGDYQWSMINSGGSGLQLRADGLLSGTAPGEGQYAIAVSVTDDTRTVSSTLILTVTTDSSPLAITTSSLPGGTTLELYAAVLNASGGDAPYTWTLLSSGGAGLSLSTAGVLRGTPSLAGTFGLTFRVSDGTRTDQVALTLTIAPGDAPELVTIVTTALPNGIESIQYTALVNAVGGQEPYTWALLSDGGTGFTLNNEGVLAGTAPATGDYALTIEVTDNGGTTDKTSFIFTATGNTPQPLAIATTALPSGIEGIQYTALVLAVGGEEPYTWALLADGGTGFTLNNEGVLAGTAPASGDYALTIEVTDSAGTTDKTSFIFTATGITPQRLAIITDALPDGIEDIQYAALVRANGGQEPYTWALLADGGTGFTLNNEGVLAGTAPASGAYALTIEVTDSAGTTDRTSFIFTATGDTLQRLAITTTALPNGIEGIQYTALVDAVGGQEPYTWALLADGGTGFTLNNEGVLAGTAPASGDYALTVEVTDSAGTTERTSFIFTATGDTPQPLAIATTSLPNAEELKEYIAILAATGGQGDYLWTLISNGGSGLLMGPDGLLSGTAPAEGQYGITVSVMDDVQTVSGILTLTVDANTTPLTITTTSLPNGTVDELYAAVLKASGGNKPYVWTLLSNGGLPSLVLSSDGVLTAVPALPGDYGVIYEVSDGISTDQLAMILTIAPVGGAEEVLRITTAPAITADRVLFATVVEATGGTAPYSWIGSDLSTPGTGFVIDPASGTITGNTNDLLPGEYGYSVTVTDFVGDTDTQGFVITIPGGDAPPVRILTGTDPLAPGELPDATAGETYAVVMRAVGGEGNATYTWEILETLPAGGPTFTPPGGSTSPGVLYWAAGDIAGGPYTITIQVTDGIDADTTTLTLNVNP